MQNYSKLACVVPVTRRHTSIPIQFSITPIIKGNVACQALHQNETTARNLNIMISDKFRVGLRKIVTPNSRVVWPALIVSQNLSDWTVEGNLEKRHDLGLAYTAKATPLNDGGERLFLDKTSKWFNCSRTYFSRDHALRDIVQISKNTIGIISVLNSSKFEDGEDVSPKCVQDL